MTGKGQRPGPLTSRPAQLPGAVELDAAMKEVRDRQRAFASAPSEDSWLALRDGVDRYAELLTSGLASAGEKAVFAELTRARDLLVNASTAMNDVQTVDDIEAAANTLADALEVLAAALDERSARTERWTRMQTPKSTPKAVATGRRHQR